MGTALLALAPVAVLHEVRGSQLREGGLVADDRLHGRR